MSYFIRELEDGDYVYIQVQDLYVDSHHNAYIRSDATSSLIKNWIHEVHVQKVEGELWLMLTSADYELEAKQLEPGDYVRVDNIVYKDSMSKTFPEEFLTKSEVAYICVTEIDG